MVLSTTSRERSEETRLIYSVAYAAPLRCLASNNEHVAIGILDVAQYGAPLPRLLGSGLANHDCFVSNKIVFVNLNAIVRHFRTEILRRVIFSNLDSI